MKKYSEKCLAVFLILTMCLGAPRVFAGDIEETVKAQIEFSNQRLKGFQTELTTALGEMQTKPSQEVFGRIQLLQQKVTKEKAITQNLEYALSDARASKSWCAIVQDMAKESTLISAGVDVVSNVYSAGKWIFGPSQEDIFGENWQQVESFNAKLVAEARAIREESQAILKALDKVKSTVSSGSGNPDDLKQLQDDLIKRLNALNDRKEKVRENMKTLIKLYKAEKENLPASTIFWGQTMGRYIDQVLKEIDLGKIVADFAYDILIDKNIYKPLIKLIKPMVKVAIGDYLARAKGGSLLTPEIIDDLTFSILFQGSQGKGLMTEAENKLKSKATGKVIEGVAQAAVEAEAQVVFAKSSQAVYATMKQSIQALPIDANFADNQMLLKKSAENMVKQNARVIEYEARNKLDKAVKTGKLIKDVWDLVLKDAIQVYLTSDSFGQAVKSANEACGKWREEYKKVGGEMIATEDEFVNSKWFSGGRTCPVGTPPAGIADPITDDKQQLAQRDVEASIKTVGEVQGLLQTEREKSPAEQGDLDIGEVQQKEDQQFEMVLQGKMHFTRMVFLNPIALTGRRMTKPCYDMIKRAIEDFQRSWPEEKCEFQGEIAACNASASCREDNKRDPGRWFRKQAACRNDRYKALEAAIKPGWVCVDDVYEQYRSFADRRGQNLLRVYKMLGEQYQKLISYAKEVSAPAVTWASAAESDYRFMEDFIKNSQLYFYGGTSGIENPDRPPLPPAGIGGTAVKPADYDVAKNKEKLKVISDGIQKSKSIDIAKLTQPLSNVDFSIEEILELFNRDPWLIGSGAPVIYESVQVADAKHLSGWDQAWTSFTESASVVQLTGAKEIKDDTLIGNSMKLYSVNPNNYQDLLTKLSSHPLIAGRDYYQKLADFSLDKALSLYQAAINAHNSAAERAQAVDKKMQEASEVFNYSTAGFFATNNFYDVFFKRWLILRKMNPGGAAQALHVDTEEFGKNVKEFESKMEDARKHMVLPDADAVKRDIESFVRAAKDYEAAYTAYTAYIAPYFPNEEIPVFEMPDLYPWTSRSDAIRAQNETIEYNFKRAADNLEEMKTGLGEMKSYDSAYVAAIQQYHGARSGVADKAIQFCKNNPDKINECLEKIATAKQEMGQVVGGGGISDHILPKSIQEAAGKVQGVDLSELYRLEQEFLEKQKKKQRRDQFSNYRITDARINSYSLSKASGDVILLSDQLKQGAIEVTGFIDHLDGIQTLLFSEDGGQSWKEIPKSQAFSASIVPLPGKRYEPILRIKTEEMDDFQIKIFENIQAIIYRDTDYKQLVIETVKKIADAYERQNVAAFGECISRDYLGNRVYLEEGVRFDFEMFIDIRLQIFINRIERRGDLYVAETKWDKTQTPRQTMQQQKTTGNTTMMFIMEEGQMKIKNLRGNLIYATLSPEIAEASGLSQTVVDQVRVAHNDRDPIQPGAGSTLDSGGVSSKLTVRQGQMRTTYATAGDCGSLRTDAGFDFSAAVEAQGAADVYVEWINMLFAVAPAQMQQSSVDFSSLTEAPAGGYGIGGVNAVAGVTIVFITQEGYYGKMRVNSANNIACTSTIVTFDYALQTDGTRNLST